MKLTSPHGPILHVQERVGLRPDHQVHPVRRLGVLLVPVFGMAASALWLGEPVQAWKIAAAALVMAGLAVNLRWRPAATPQA